MKWIDISENYQASDEGQIRNKRNGHILKQFIHKDGYLRTQFDGKSQTVHRIIAKCFLPKIKGKDYVNHKDGNKQNNHVENLEWCTRSENMKHAYEIGLKHGNKGVNNGRCILSLEDVRYIKNHYKKGDKVFGATALSKKFNVAPQTISAVTSGQNWSYL